MNTNFIAYIAFFSLITFISFTMLLLTSVASNKSWETKYKDLERETSKKIGLTIDMTDSKTMEPKRIEYTIDPKKDYDFTMLFDRRSLDRITFYNAE